MIQLYRSAPIKLGEYSAVPESEINRNVQILRIGTFTHPDYGTFEITKEHLLSMQKNFDAKVRGVDIAIDYAHESHKEAAAWIQGLHLSEDGAQLWAEVIWTVNGKETLIKREYRYLSADFTFDYQDNETLKKFGAVLFGAGLTNRPVVKNMAPAIELSEGKNKMDIKKEEPKAADPVIDPKDAKIAELEAKISELMAKMGSGEAELAAKQKQLDEMELASKVAKEEKALAEKTAKFNALMSEGKLVEAQREAFMQNDAMKLAELSQQVKLSAQGSGSTPAPVKNDGESAEDKVLKLAEALVEKKEVKDLSEGIQKVLSENGELAKKVRE